ncbi:MAG: YdcF family protein [Clostridia bacterium]|nr:YdcF family protein [Clostridia bacterium]
MKKAVKTTAIVCGTLLLGNGLLMSLIANFNIGLVPVYGLGAVLTAYGVFFDRIKKRVILDVILGVGISVLLGFGIFIGAYGGNDTADYREETVIVLGCGIRGERVSVGLAKRLDKAYEYHRRNPEALIIVSGGQGPQEDIPEALAMKRYLMGKGIPEHMIIMEDKSTSTITNFRNTYAIMQEKGMSTSSVVFVTNAYHVYRSAYYAKAEGFLEASHLGTNIIWYTVPMNYMREMLAIVKMWVFDKSLF